ncbi:hypothetical protein ASG01_08860 [Chryseobacterium sp. Leaf180]|uniref:hypothetical protein n=1 Tax=Chryseobacterium sp. Leaf180 TaxID=1736289 RepID=UPI0006FA1A3B|nr:hypothetical protein [Chryseobacterium sp. Leaf180]KQR93297.1 hypothetical protein ASG01_08860 [Chryseobacterium sp. Leaf180]
MLNLKKCAVALAVAYLGGIMCDEKQVLGIMLVDRSVRIDPANFVKSTLDGLIASNKIIGTLKDFNAEDADVDPAYTDLQNGDRNKNTIGRKGWNITFFKGSCFQNQIQKLDKSENYGIILVYEDGSFLAQQLKDGKIKGFDVKLFTGVKKVKTGTEGGGSMLMIDVTRSAMAAWQGSSAIYESPEIDFMEIQPVAALDLKIGILSAGATTTTVTISHLCADSPVTGLTDATKFQLVRNEVPEAITSMSSVGNVYTLTHAALAADQSVYFKTNTVGNPVIVLDTNYYAGRSVTKNVVA